MSGFTRSVGKTLATTPTQLSGKEVIGLMRKHRVRIDALAFRLGTTQKRVRKIRRVGLQDALAIRDWTEAITGDDPGPIPNKYRLANSREATDCCFCGCPLISGDQAFEYVGEVFCSITCCRKSRGW